MVGIENVSHGFPPCYICRFSLLFPGMSSEIAAGAALPAGKADCSV